MNLARIVVKNMRQHALSTSVTALSVALAGGLLMSVWSIRDQARNAFTQYTSGFDAVLGARGSALQLVLNAVFHLEASPGNISWEDYLDVRGHPLVKNAVPIALGDNYRGFRVVGVTTNFFHQIEYREDRRIQAPPPGRVFNPTLKEAVVGDYAAKRLNLKIGQKFRPYHGLNFDASAQHQDEYVVVGILEPTGTPIDRVLWIPLLGIQHMTGHAEQASTQISAVLLQLNGMQAGFRLDALYNKQGDRLTFAFPIGTIVAKLFDKISWFDRVLECVAFLVALVASASILASMYNSMNERRRDIAILRALGARRSFVLSAILLEAVAVAVLGVFASYLIYAGILSSTAAIIRSQTGVMLDGFAWNSALAWTPLLMVALSGLAGLVPAVKAYRTSVADHLSPIS